jgi:hypothetical protein
MLQMILPVRTAMPSLSGLSVVIVRCLRRGSQNYQIGLAITQGASRTSSIAAARRRTPSSTWSLVTAE